jgi:hypothetical protein
MEPGGWRRGYPIHGRTNLLAAFKNVDVRRDFIPYSERNARHREGQSLRGISEWNVR